MRETRILEDGTHWYRCGHGYKPLAPEERKNKVNKPDDPRAVRVYAKWYLPLDLLADEEREMPATRPDEETLEHRALCKCDVCRRPAAKELWAMAMRNKGPRPLSPRQSARADGRL